MKIDKLPGLKTVTIKELLPGDCFTYPDTRMALMKTSDKNSNNVISLYNGNLSTIHEDTKVIPLPNAHVAFPEEADSFVEETKSFVKKEEKEWYDYTFKEIKLNHCKQLAGCYDCPIADACQEDLEIAELMDVLNDILDE